MANNLPRIPVVYLAGGMRSNWQDKVKQACKGLAIFIDPREHGLGAETAYTAWDLSGVAAADIVFGYIEKDNPNGAGLALEFGAAYQAQKHILYVEEPGFPFSLYFGMVRSVADSRTDSLEVGMASLKLLLTNRELQNGQGD